MHFSNVLVIALLVTSAATVAPSSAQEATAGQTSADEAAYWEMVRDPGDTIVQERFLERFPVGLHAADARAKLAARTKPNGKEGDVWAVNGAPEPDIVIYERNLSLSARCDNSFKCQLKVPRAPAKLSLKIINYGNTLDETIGQGSCELGSTCQFESATVTFGKC
jgi:hypothetical protein